MAKKKQKQKQTKTNDDDLFEEIASETDGKVLADIDNCSFFLDTGSVATNYVCSGRFASGGVPGNRITEVYGPSASGKSLLANNVLYGCQKLGGWPIILDCENATNAEWMAKASHINTKRVLRYTPFTLEQAFLKIHNAVKTIREREIKLKRERKPIVVVYDSISVSPCEREFRETDLPEDYNPTMWKRIVGAKEQPGERARIIGKELRKLIKVLEEQDVTLVIINQTREKIGVMFGSPETRPGGKALEFYASLILRTQQKKKIENKELKTFAGINLQVKNIKNRSFRPFCVTEGIKLYFDSGINPLTGLLTVLMEDERIIAGKGGNYTVAESFAGNPEEPYKFKSSLERNEVPLSVLKDNPKLIDLETSEEVEDYFKPFLEAIGETASGAYVEKKIVYDMDGSPLDYEEEEEEEEEEESYDE